jgi:hypothetical protein
MFPQFTSPEEKHQGTTINAFMDFSNKIAKKTQMCTNWKMRNDNRNYDTIVIHLLVV